MLLPETQRVWDFLKEQRALEGFVLVGGSALALRIQHRQSEDLDFAYPEVRLPLARLDALQRVGQQAGIAFEEEPDEAAAQQFFDAGLELRDFQQNMIVSGAVKVSFFAADPALKNILGSSLSEPHARIATMKELFQSKCLVSAVRSKSRDWLDLYLLLRDHGFSGRDFVNAFREAGTETQIFSALSRLCSGVPQRDDEGYAQLLSNPPTLSTITEFFVNLRDEVEVQLAAEARKRENPNL